MKLSSRLKTIAHFIPRKTAFIDVGSDHAYVPIYCVQVLGAHRVIASEIRRQPYERSVASVIRFGVEDRVEVRLGDGLSVVSPKEVEGALIAGMGGSAMVGILSRGWPVVESLKYLVLQPMEDEDELRYYLQSVGWGVKDETIFIDGGISYQLMLMIPTPKPQLTPWEAKFGPLNWARPNQALKEVVGKHLMLLLKINQEMRNSTDVHTAVKRKEIKMQIAQLEEVLNQW